MYKPNSDDPEERMETKEGVLLTMFKEENWTKLFLFVDFFCSCVGGRPKFDDLVIMKCDTEENKAKRFTDIVSISDIAYCLVNVENQREVWKALREGKRGQDLPKPLFSQTQFFGRNNNSKRLQEEFQNYYIKVKYSLSKCDLKKLTEAFQMYCEERRNSIIKARDGQGDSAPQVPHGKQDKQDLEYDDW